ncbi:MAG: hypothetical protein DRI71_04660 [Bacteroidetes bacterium]|nr:MAG: hypothetical protein DRI71_04660 [Bacteroidota bacterium]
MIDFLLGISLVSGLMIFLFVISIFSLLVYLTSHYFIKGQLQKNHEKVGRILFRVSASLLGLILSITFANQRVNYFSLKRSIEAEAATIVDIKVDIDLYDNEEAELIKEKLMEYVMHVSTDGWKSLQNDPFRSKAFVLFQDIYVSINHLEVQTPLQTRLKNNMLSDIDHLSDYLQVRLYSFREKSNPLIYTSVFGILGIMILFSVYPPDKLTIGFLLIYVAFIGIVLYFILMMSNPLKGPLMIEPGPFLLIKETIESKV